MIVYQTTNVKLEYDSLSKQLIQTWFNFVPSDEFRKAIDFTVEFVKKNEVKSILSDTLKQRAVKPQDSEYAASVMPQLFGSGLVAMAFLIPEDIFTKMSLKKFADIEVKSQHNVEYFFDLAEAQKWITSAINKIH